MQRPSIPVPPGLIDALDGALETGVRMRPEHVAGVLDWLHGVIAMNCESHVALSVDEMVLVAHALGDAIGAPIAEIDTEHVRDLNTAPVILPQLLRITDPNNLVPELTAALRNKGFMEAECCGQPVGMANPDAFDVGASPDFSCPSCGSSFVVAVEGDKKVLVRKEDA